MMQAPKIEQKTVKKGFYTIQETYVNKFLYMTSTSFNRKDSLANRFDDFGKPLELTMKKIKLYKTETKEVQRLDPQSLIAIWGSYYGFAMLFPLLGTFAGIISREIFLYIMILPITAFALYIFISHDKLERLITHRRIKVVIEV